MNDEASPVPTTTEPADAAALGVGAALERLYGEIAERSMRGLPVYNAALRVESVGFRAVGGRAVGIVATPWFMNLVVAALPGGEALPPRPAGASIDYAFAGGDFACVVGEMDGFGRVDSASLFSPMFQFDDPEVVRAVAEAAIAEITTAPEPAPAEPVPEPVRLDRRALLFGRRGGEGGTSWR